MEKINTLINTAYAENARLSLIATGSNCHMIGNLRNQLNGYASLLASDFNNSELIARLTKALNASKQF